MECSVQLSILKSRVLLSHESHLGFRRLPHPGALHHLGQSVLAIAPTGDKDASCPGPRRPLLSPSFILRHRPPCEGHSDLSHLQTFSLLHPTLTPPSYSPVKAISTGMNNCRDKNQPLQVSVLESPDPTSSLSPSPGTEPL